MLQAAAVDHENGNIIKFSTTANSKSWDTKHVGSLNPKIKETNRVALYGNHIANRHEESGVVEDVVTLGNMRCHDWELLRGTLFFRAVFMCNTWKIPLIAIQELNPKNTKQTPNSRIESCLRFGGNTCEPLIFRFRRQQFGHKLDMVKDRALVASNLFWTSPENKITTIFSGFERGHLCSISINIRVGPAKRSWRFHKFFDFRSSKDFHFHFRTGINRSKHTPSATTPSD